jgi:hypothetical protein
LAASRLIDCLPVVRHRPIDESKLAAFSERMDRELQDLERRFEHFTTPGSLRAFLRG